MKRRRDTWFLEGEGKEERREGEGVNRLNLMIYDRDSLLGSKEGKGKHGTCSESSN
jgi:hypothetical protein